MTPFEYDLIALPLVFLSTFLEGEAAIITATILSATGSFHTWVVVAGGIIGTCVGDQLVYVIGRVIGRPERAVLFGRQIVSREAVERARHYFSRHGGKTIFLLRYAFGLRTAGYFLAGAVRMPYLRFLIADLLGTSTWVVILVVIGLAVGKSVFTVLGGWIGLGVGVLSGLLITVFVIRYQRTIRPDESP